MSQPATAVVTRYLDSWNETDPDARRSAVAAAFCPDARYVDPLADVTGVEAIDATIAAVQGQFPGLVFSLVGEVDAHHDVCRFRWGLGPAGEEPLVVGFDVAEVDGDDRIRAVRGFLDKVPG